MASKAGKVVKLIGMWLILPAGLAALGYYVIGPKLGASPAGEKPGKAATSPDGVQDATSASKSYSEPKIEVSVKKGTTLSASDIRPRRKRKPKPVETAPPPGGTTAPAGDGTQPSPTTPVAGGDG